MNQEGKEESDEDLVIAEMEDGSTSDCGNEDRNEIVMVLYH